MLKHIKIKRLNLYLIAITLIYSYLYAYPTFFSGELIMKNHPIIPSLSQIGDDFRQFREFSISWIHGTELQFSRNNIYPPLFTLLLTPFALISFKGAYYLLSFIIFLSYIFVTLIYPVITSKNKENINLIAPLFLVGLFCYPFQFALERGQVDLISFALIFLAIYIFHFQKKFRVIAYGLFCISVQMKIYPAIFALALIDNYKNWKKSIKSIVLLALVNFGLLFILGYKKMFHMIESIVSWSGNPYLWEGNSSVKSSITLMFRSVAGKLKNNHPSLSDTIVSSIPHVEKFIILSILFIILYTVYRMYKNNQKGFNPYLISLCSIACLIIPAESHDYRLAVLGGVIGPLLLIPPFVKRRSYLIGEGILFLIMICFSSTLWFWWEKKAHSFLFRFNMPSLLTIFVLTFILFKMKENETRSELAS